MKKIRVLICIMLFSLLFIPFDGIKGAGEYTVSSINTNGNITQIGTYDNYNDALSSMNSYNSTMENVACIYRNGKMVNTRYGVFRPTSSSTVYFYTDYGSRSFSVPYGSEAVVIGYDPSTSRVKIKISGATGYIDQNAGNVQPISFLTDGSSSISYDTSKTYAKVVSISDLRLREGPGLNYPQISGMWAKSGSTYEWLNKGSTVMADGYEWFQINVNGTIGYVANYPADIYMEEFIPIASQRKDYITYYYVSSAGKLIHQYYATVSSNSNDAWYVSLGPAPKYLKQNKNYYSYDGNYFYETFASMVDDYVSNSHARAVNKEGYYNYYQYMPARTQTVFNADNINAYLARQGYVGKFNRDKYYESYFDPATNSYKWRWIFDESANAMNGIWAAVDRDKSMLYGEGQTFIDSQNQYGVNAAQTFALSVNESGWGRSYIAVREYNIFGHAAYDSNPDAATQYNTIADGIKAHAYKYISLDYDNPNNGAHYFGGHYGNKLSGNNVSYATDPYWGEKMANQYSGLDEYLGFQEFRKSVNIGIKQMAGSIPAKKEPNNASTTYYNLSSAPEVPVSILETVHGEEINGNDIWYKVQSDIPIDSNRNALSIEANNYNFETSYVYVHSSYIYNITDEPIIYAEDTTIKANAKIETPLAWDDWDGYVNVSVKESNLNTNVAGNYQITYQATDSENNTATKTINVTVLADSNPVINASDVEIEQDSTFDPLDYVTASDYEDGDITNLIKVTTNTVDTTKLGEYKVIYSVTDTTGRTVTKEIKVTVKKIEYEKHDSEYYFEYLKYESGLELKGFITISNFNNDLSNDIQYKLILTNNTTNEVYEKNLDRVLLDKDMPFILDTNKYSWFSGKVDLTDIPNGDYTLSIKAICGKIYAESPLSNVFGKDMPASFNANNRNFFLRNNYESRNAAIQLFIRDIPLGEKTSNVRYNIGNEYYSINIIENNLVIRGASHIIGGDYAIGTTVNRKMIFENISNFATYNYDIGSITDGDYPIELRVSDGMDKTRAWFATSIDLSDIEIGTYSIYISTSSNLSDYGELQDIFSRNITATKTINNKKYSFKVDKENRYRILMIVENN